MTVHLKNSSLFLTETLPPVHWYCSDYRVDYQTALTSMEERATKIALHQAPETVWLLEHPPLYTAGTSAQDKDLLTPQFPVYNAGRGGQYTYHGPGQRIAYLMLNLKARKPDLRAFVFTLEEWIINSLQEFNIKGERRQNRVGVWVVLPSGEEKKIAAIGIRVKKWVTLHGIAVNINPDLRHYAGIVPCGIQSYGVTSMAELNKVTSFSAFDKALEKNFIPLFGNLYKPSEPFIN